ncbi:LEAF RUST 10 DISEASE-RESISTANCE LOCUS RECEPTOR-LIKE PROTEIN KINASE-like 2.5 [Abrus precatorius]|uniref:LEAF RUST 10 DISEASE-RESISTANCE LOCUS RECEPTOR-LIKE PROTEIN KINASE-like 2.5 n=1 Tax=Abrus precatorius TaxID=3816 RepID=A0A8B8K7C4_ABRPR|nr:LEAF RUST 10 DISEASE-RESISTANCE LOCUS RECEPTOR-LIKE PROTEIN KINASE-like 2.5 [Abrus precatorius]
MGKEGWYLSCSCAHSLVLIFATILLLFQQNCTAKNNPPCPPSSCGKIGNISYPFRLRGEPSHCGDPRYQLDCVNNATLLTLFSGKYHVQDIDYKRYKMVVSDAGAGEDATCSFIPRYFLSDGSFRPTGLVGPDDFGSQPFLLDPIDPPRIAYFNCTNPVTGDPRYVKVDTSGCGSRGHVYALLEPSLFDYRVKDIKVGCNLTVATLGSSRKLPETQQGNVSYDEIHRIIVEGFQLSWLPVICEDRCGKGTNCEVINESNGQVQCNKHYCHYAYHTTDKCEYWQQIIGYTRAYLRGIIFGIGSRITFSTKQLDNPVGLEYFDGGIFIGRNVVPIFVAARYLFGIVLLLVLLIYKWRRRHLSIYENIEIFLLDSSLNPIRYEYKEIKKMTGGFKVKLGEGGFGSVYKGKLRSGLDVAVKMLLSKSNANGQDFISEVATIGRIHHVNVVRLVGYCVDGKKRALVYEFMLNGSLDKYIFSKEGSDPLSYEKIYEISVGIARGIAYIHQGCDMQILHFDIKPHNILLDDNFIPKVSDFGLAKLYPVDDSIVPLTAARGTLGYMAPELFYKNMGGVSYKADVYSFGMLLMEMASKRRNTNPHAEHSSQHYFPFWIYDQFKEEKNIDMVDASEEDNILAKKMFMVALWCIQLKPSDRPSMNKVVEMLEGEIESLELPQRPSFYPDNIYVHDELNSGQTSFSSSSYSDSYHDESITGDSPRIVLDRDRQSISN